MSVDYVVFQRKLAEDRQAFRDAIQEFESASTRDIDRLIRKEMIRNQGAKGSYKEQLLAEKRKVALAPLCPCALVPCAE